MRHLALTYLCVIFAHCTPCPAFGFCQEAVEPYADPLIQDKENSGKKSDQDKKAPPDEESKRSIEDLYREMEKLVQEISAEAIRAAKKGNPDETFRREIETLRGEMAKKVQAIKSAAIAAAKKNPRDEEYNREIDSLRRDIGKIAQEISAKVAGAAPKSVPDEEFKSKMDNIRRDMIKIGQELKAKSGTVGREVQQQPSADILASIRILRLRGRHSEAAAQYSQFIAKNPDSPRLFEARFWLAKSLFEDQKWADAATAYTEFLKNHPDQRTFSQVAKGDRIHCWKQQPKDPKAIANLRDALKDTDADTRILAALALAENKNPAGREVLEGAVGNPKFGEQCALALWKLGLRSKPTGQGDTPWARLIVFKVKTEDDSFEIKVPLTFIRGMEKMMPEDARIEMERAGVPKVDVLSELAASAPKGTTIFQYKGDKGKTFVVITVE